MFLEDLGLKESGLEKLIKASYSLLKTRLSDCGRDRDPCVDDTQRQKAPQAAGKIHSDFERGFIRAEVVNYQDLASCGSYSLRGKGTGRTGKKKRIYAGKGRRCHLIPLQCLMATAVHTNGGSK